MAQTIRDYLESIIQHTDEEDDIYTVMIRIRQAARAAIQQIDKTAQQKPEEAVRCNLVLDKTQGTIERG